MRPRSSSLPPAPAEADGVEERESGESLVAEEAPLARASEVVEIAARPVLQAEPPPPAPEPVAKEDPPPAAVIAAPEPAPPQSSMSSAKVEEAPAKAEEPPPVAMNAQAAPSGGKKKKKKKHGDRASGAPTTSVEQAPAHAAGRDAHPAVVVAAKEQAPAVEKALSQSSPKHGKPVLLTASGKPADEDVDLSISHRFFADGDSMPPPAAHEHDHEPLLHEEKAPPPTKEVLAHRARLKRIVGGVVVAAGVFALIGVGKALFTSKSADAMPTNTALEARLPEPKKAEPAAAKEPAKEPAAAAVAEQKPAEKKDDAKPADSAAPAPSASADAAKPDDAKPEEKNGAAAQLSDKEIKELKSKAAMTANGGDMTKAIDAAKAAIAADPTDAMSYMYLYTDYSNIGKMKDASEALNECVRTATSADKWQCSQWGGHK